MHDSMFRAFERRGALGAMGSGKIVNAGADASGVGLCVPFWKEPEAVAISRVSALKARAVPPS